MLFFPFATERKIRHARSGHPEILPQQPVGSALKTKPTEEEVATAMKAMKNAKTVGSDGLPVELLKLGLR